MKAELMGKFINIQHTPDMVISTSSVSQNIPKSECDKSAGPDRICAEYLKFSNVKIHALLALCICFVYPMVIYPQL